jgi:hypothetical protein
MIKRLKSLVLGNKTRQQQIIRQNQELIWAQIYHDSIRGRDYIENLPLNIGRWAGNYSFFYLLNRIMHDVQPSHILELGLGESTKFISSCINHLPAIKSHTIVEQNKSWLESFQDRFKLHDKSIPTICPLESIVFQGNNVECYQGLENQIEGVFDFYLVDGPFGSPHFSRIDILFLTKRLKSKDKFIILVDDYDRVGEQETVELLKSHFKEMNIPIYCKVYSGLKQVFLMVSKEYQYLTTL